MVTLKDVEEGAVSLRKVGESLAGLKGKTMHSTLLSNVYRRFSVLVICYQCQLGYESKNTVCISVNFDGKFSFCLLKNMLFSFRHILVR